MSNGFLVVGPGTVLTSNHVIAHRQARDLRRGIEDLSRLRYDLAHENAHLQLLGGANSTGMTACLEAIDWLAAVARLNEWLQAPSSDADPASALVAQQPDGGPWLLPKFNEAALPRDSGVALLRLLDGILAALCLMLVRVLAALSRHPDALMFVLIMLAACLRYGRREEPGDHAFLLTRRYQTSLGSCPQS
jgi:hypothetical protein